MFQFQFMQDHNHNQEDADRHQTSNHSEGIGIEIITSASGDAADDNADGVNDVSSMRPSSKKSKKNSKYAGVVKTTLGIIFVGSFISLAVALVKVKKGINSTELQLAMSKETSSASSKSGKSCKNDEFKVCVIEPFIGIFSFLTDITDCTNGPFNLPDEKDFFKDWKKYVRNCSGFWGNVFYFIQYVTVYIVNLFCSPARRVLNANVFAPATRALDQLAGISDVHEWLEGIDFAAIGNFIDNNVPNPECNDARNSIEAIFVGDVCTDEIVDKVDKFASYVNVCLNDDDWDWDAVEDFVSDLFEPIF
mmetsp:Transcript_23885/g.39366  ORF Transcript_23885/g.39366 Transcript_23885/m.39366 type:complete len:306 (-) Transcript_23885:236-1153(-)